MSSLSIQVELFVKLVLSIALCLPRQLHMARTSAAALLAMRPLRHAGTAGEADVGQHAHGHSHVGAAARPNRVQPLPYSQNLDRGKDCLNSMATVRRLFQSASLCGCLCRVGLFTN